MPNIVVSRSTYHIVKVFYRSRSLEISQIEECICKKLMDSWSYDISMELVVYNDLIDVFTMHLHNYLLREAQNNVSTNQ